MTDTYFKDGSSVAFNANCGTDVAGAARTAIVKPNPGQSPADTPDATPGVDYSPASHRLVLPARTRAFQHIIQSYRDTIREGDEYLLVDLAIVNLLGRVEVGPDSATVTIENALQPTLSTTGGDSVIEGQSFTVNVDYAHTMGQTITLPLHTDRRSAEAVDYSAPSTHTFAHGASSGSFTVTTTEDDDYDDDVFDIWIQGEPVRSNTLRMIIKDNDPRPPLWSSWSSTLTAKDGVSFLGCTEITAGIRCSDHLTQAEFEHGGTGYSVQRLSFASFTGFVILTLDKTIPDELRSSATLHLGSKQFAFRNGQLSNSGGAQGNSIAWGGGGLSWTEDQEVLLRLTGAGNNGGMMMGGGNPPPANDNPPPANDNPPPANNNPPPTDTGGGGGGGGGGSLASDASLRTLTVRASAGGENFDETPALAPAFDADTLEYAASVPFSTTHARLTPRTVNPDATVRIGPRGGERAELSVLEPSAVFALAIGENVFEIAVTAEDEETAQTYAVTVTRAPPPLRGLTLRVGDDGESFDESSGESLALTPSFDPSVTEYAAAALFSMTHARLTPELGQEDATAQIGLRGGELSDAAGGEPGPALALTVGENVFEITVTAAGGTAATYTVTVTRPAPPVPLDATAAREHLFPLLADGDGFRVRLFLTNVSAYPRNACTLTLHGPGLDAGRFEAHPALTVSGGELKIDSGPTGAGVALATGGAGELAFGYARLACAEPAAARLLLARESGGVPAALANQDSARPARLHRFPLLSRLGRPGLALANDGDAAAACAVEVETAAGESAGGGNLALPARGVAFRFVDEIASRENGEEEAETDGGAVTVTCDRPVAALAVPLTAADVFTALAGAVPETDETTEEAEAVPARRVLPLVLEGAGFRSRLEVTNRSDADNGCALEFHGAGVNTARFPSSADLVRDGFRRATFELAQDERIAMTSFGRHSYAYGYAVLDCEGPVEAHSLLTAGDGDEADGMAPIPPAQFAREVRFPVAPGLDRMALFLTNAEETDAVCEASLTPAGGEETAAAASIEVGAESTALRFLADLFELPADFAGGSAALSCDREIAAVALPTTAAAAFAALPPVAQGFRDDAQDAEE